MLPFKVVYHDRYDLNLGPHVFPSQKYRMIRDRMLQEGFATAEDFVQPQAAVADAWNVIVPLLRSGAIKPIVAKTFPLPQAAEALRYLVEGRPFGRVVLKI